MTVYVLVYHDPWDLAQPGPEDVSVEGVFSMRGDAIIATGDTLLLDESRTYLREGNDDTSPYYTIEEHGLDALRGTK